MSKDWIYSTNVYEVNLRQYTEEGTFAAFARHLPRLKDMGVQTLWFMPVTPISQKVKKGSMGSYYACSDYTSINPEFGTIEDFKSLAKEAHEMGFKIIIDWVANHTGWDHIWTVQHPEWYKKDEHTGDFKRASGMDDIIELDFENDAMSRALIDAMKFWVMNCDVDGFRCDLAFWVQLDFWVQAKETLDKIKPLFWLAESDSLDHPEYMQVFDAAYTWTWMHKTEEFYKKDLPYGDLMQVLHRYQSAPGIKAWFTSNHDENSWNGTEYEKYGEMAKLLAVFSCTWQGLPLIYSGQELPNLKRLKFFDKDVIDWKDNFELHDFYKTLLYLHSINPALRSDNNLHSFFSENNVLSFQRTKDEQKVIVILNFSAHQLNWEFKEDIKGVFRNIFSGQEIDLAPGKNILLSPWKYLVLTN